MISFRELGTDDIKDLRRMLQSNPRYLMKMLEIELSDGLCPVCKKPRRIPCSTSILGSPCHCGV